MKSATDEPEKRTPAGEGLTNSGKLPEEALLKSQTLLANALEIAQLGHWEYDVDRDVFTFNDQFYRLFRTTVEEMGGYAMPSAEYARRFVHPDDAHMVAEETRKAIETADPRYSRSLEHRIRYADGQTGYIAVRYSLVKDAHGKTIKTYGVNQDITERRQAEDALRTGERRYRQLFETMTEGVALHEVVYDENGNAVNYRIIDTNEAYHRHSGLPAESAKGTLATALYGTETAPFLKEFSNVAHTGIPASFEVFFPPLEKHFTVTIFSPGKGMFATVFADITDRKRSEEEIRMLKHSIDQHVDSMFWLDTDNRFVYVNDAALRSLGYRREELIGRSLSDVSLKATYQGVNAVWEQLRATGTYTTESIHRRKDGTEFPVEIVSSHVRFAGKEYNCTFAIDVTKRKLIEQTLLENQQRLDLALRSANMGVWSWDIAEDKRTFDQQCCQLLGIDPAAFTGTAKEFFNAVHPGDQAVLTSAMQQTLERDALYKPEYRVVKADGSIRHIAARGRLIRDDSGQPARVLGIVWDVTERTMADAEKEKLKNQLAQSQKLESIGRLAGGVAHDFNNMLTVILGNTEIALVKSAKAVPVRAELNEIVKAAERSTVLTRQLLAFARKQTIAPKVLDLNDTVAGMLKMLKRLIGEDIDLHWAPKPGLWPVRMDPSQLDQVLVNLCVNSRDAIDGVGKLTIEAENTTFDDAYCAVHPGFYKGDFIRLAVSDDGCGMDQDTMTQLFEPFFTTKGAGKGTGLGLATVYGIVKQNNGFINVYSEPGQGTTLTTYFPRHAGSAAVESPVESKAKPLRGKEAILVVEDEPDILKLTEQILKLQGYTVIPASTPGEAIRLAGDYAGKIDMVMTDVVMPEMNGRDLAKKLLTVYPHIKCLFTSGYTADVIAHHGVLDADVHFIGKPFSVQDLAAKVREVLDKQ